MNKRRIIVVGGGPAGFFAAITCAEADANLEVVLLEKTSQFLSKVRISGGGRCNVTHACFDEGELSSRYPRGGPALRGAFHAFQARDTVDWFERRGVKLKTERDGRMFPATDSSQTIMDCLIAAAQKAGIKLRNQCGVDAILRRPDGRFDVTFNRGETLAGDAVLVASGGCRAPELGQLAVSLGHTLEPPTPSLFTFQVETSWIRQLAGVSVESVEASAPGTGLRERGPLLMTHWGLSGPVILRLSAWGARILRGLNYSFPLHLNWLPDLHAEAIATAFQSRRKSQPARFVVNSAIPPLTTRLWEQLTLAAGIPKTLRWAALSGSASHRLIQQLNRTELSVVGKSLNKDEFVTCGGVRLAEVNFKTMESRLCPGLYFAGELLDIDGLTGGFNFQAAWTTGWIAGQALAAGAGWKG